MKPQWENMPYQGGGIHSKQSGSSAPGWNTQEKRLEFFWNYTGGYFDNHGHLKEEYVIRTKVKPFVRELKEAYPPLTMNQLRRFFNHTRLIEAKLLRGVKPYSWEEVRTDFLKLDEAVADAYGKRPPKISKLFHDFIMKNVEVVRTSQDTIKSFMSGFLPHFEALVGFASGELKEERKEKEG